MGEREVTITAADGERLAGTLFLPDPARHGEGPYAALMEALPYRKDDVTASYRSTYERYADAGFAVLRLDLRGTGSSSGVMPDEYPEVERADLRAAIEWLASQPWSSGRVGMFGTSYSGFNSLQMACEGVPQLGAVVATYATDDRYTDDVHYSGGVLRAIDLIDYPLYMVAMNALPPVPAVYGDGWRDEWRRRAEQSPPWLLEWLSNPFDGPTWRRGSVRLGPGGAGYERMSCPTMLIAGWADGYRNNTFRTVEQYERNGLPWRLLAGPWVHKSPATARPGPNVDDDVEILAFFDQHLRGGDGSGAAPGQVYVRRPVAPEPDLAFHPGVWRDLMAWPPPGLFWLTLRPAASDGRIDELVARGDVGVAAWNSCGGGLPWGQPLDQREDDAHSLTYDWAVDELLDSPAELLGSARLALRVRPDQAYGHVAVKLCDVFPDGTSALIARGMLDLTHAGCWPADPGGEVGRRPAPLRPGEWMAIEIDLDTTTWTLQPGHTLRLSIAGTDWPNCWPPPGPVTIGVDVASIGLSVPLVDGLPESVHAFTPGPGPSDDEVEGVVWRIERDVLARETRAITRYGGTYEGQHGATVTDDYRGELGVSTVNPALAWARGSATFEIRWPEATVRAESTLSVQSDDDSFDVELSMVAVEIGDAGQEIEVARRTWSTSFPR